MSTSGATFDWLAVNARNISSRCVSSSTSRRMSLRHRNLLSPANRSPWASLSIEKMMGIDLQLPKVRNRAGRYWVTENE